LTLRLTTPSSVIASSSRPRVLRLLETRIEPVARLHSPYAE
jgi:hypothetical protein